MENNRSFYAGKARELWNRGRGKRTYLLFRKQMFRGNLSRDYIIFKLDYSPGRPSCIHKGIRYDLDLSRSRQPSQLQSFCERNLSQVGSWTPRLTIARLGRIHRSQHRGTLSTTHFAPRCFPFAKSQSVPYFLPPLRFYDINRYFDRRLIVGWRVA